ncbi:MAG TPA: hypothetical protein VHZ24_19650 [Pirellulales bacterium]|jgi:hypothetical protein|nr:hypothetical protein [Pirellulales bacterium]
MSRPGDLSIVSSSLHFAMKGLLERWDDVQSMWDDPVSQALQKEYLDPLAPQVTTVLKAVNRLSQVMARAYEECTE